MLGGKISSYQSCSQRRNRLREISDLPKVTSLVSSGTEMTINIKSSEYVFMSWHIRLIPGIQDCSPPALGNLFIDITALKE